jgi:hypothetical protein
MVWAGLRREARLAEARVRDIIRVEVIQATRPAHRRIVDFATPSMFFRTPIFVIVGSTISLAVTWFEGSRWVAAMLAYGFAFTPAAVLLCLYGYLLLMRAQGRDGSTVIFGSRGDWCLLQISVAGYVLSATTTALIAANWPDAMPVFS